MRLHKRHLSWHGCHGGNCDSVNESLKRSYCEPLTVPARLICYTQSSRTHQRQPTRMSVVSYYMALWQAYIDVSSLKFRRSSAKWQDRRIWIFRRGGIRQRPFLRIKMACRHPCDDSGAIKVNFSCTATRNLSTLKKLHRRQIQGDQKFSVHLMVTIRKVTSNVQSDPRQSALTRRTLFSRNAFSTARSKLRMCSVMVIFRSSIAWGLFDYNESGAQRIFDHPIYLSVTTLVGS